MASLTAGELIDLLALEPLEGEGGYYRRVHLSETPVATASLGNFSSSHLPLVSTIYYLMTPDSFSTLHRLAGVEIWTWIAGDPVEQVVVLPSKEIEKRVIGPPHLFPAISVVEAGCWQGSRLLPGCEAGYALCSTVMTPAYDQKDFILAIGDFCDDFPEHEGYLLQFMAKGRI